MIKIINGNILDAKEDVISHQVNCMGVMGSGLAKQIKDKYPRAFKQYQKLICERNDLGLLGFCQIVDVDNNKYIANLFGQYKYGKDKRHTDYTALRDALYTLKANCKDNNKSIALPYNIGCGLGGGDWSIVYRMIEEIFKDDEVIIYKYK